MPIIRGRGFHSYRDYKKFCCVDACHNCAVPFDFGDSISFARAGQAEHILPSLNVKTARSRRGILPSTHLAREGRMTVTIGRRELLAALGGAAAALTHFPTTRSLHGGCHGSSIVSCGDSAFRCRNCGAQNRPRGSVEDLPTRAWRLARRLVLKHSRVDLARTRTHRVDADANRARRALAFAIKVD